MTKRSMVRLFQVYFQCKSVPVQDGEGSLPLLKAEIMHGPVFVARQYGGGSPFQEQGYGVK
jgi:hypothetical protein